MPYSYIPTVEGMMIEKENKLFQILLNQLSFRNEGHFEAPYDGI
jgi:hypothetical protein